MIERRARRRSRLQNGYSLIEVLVAIAILSVVMLSILSLFILARRNVYSGQQMSKANAVATRVLEDLSYMTADEVLTHFGLSDSTALSSPCLTAGGVTYNNCVALKTTDASPTEYVTRWKNVVNDLRFSDGRVALVVTPTGGASGTEFSDADFVRLNVVVGWSEMQRNRVVAMSTAKPQR